MGRDSNDPALPRVLSLGSWVTQSKLVKPGSLTFKPSKDMHMSRHYEGDQRSWWGGMRGGGAGRAQSYDLVSRDSELKGSENSSYEPVTCLGGHEVGLAPPKRLLVFFFFFLQVFTTTHDN